jgi:lysine/ornithine N-monooxygenase
MIFGAFDLNSEDDIGRSQGFYNRNLGIGKGKSPVLPQGFGGYAASFVIFSLEIFQHQELQSRFRVIGIALVYVSLLASHWG